MQWIQRQKAGTQCDIQYPVMLLQYEGLLGMVAGLCHFLFSLVCAISLREKTKRRNAKRQNKTSFRMTSFRAASFRRENTK